MSKILIIDDQSSWREFNLAAVTEILGENNTVHFANNAAEGYDKLLENILEPYDIIFTDMQMEDDYFPKLAGEWLIEQVKELVQYEKSKIVVISASPKAEFIAEQLGVFCITKQSAAASRDKYKEILLS